MLLQIKKDVAVTCNFAFGTNALEYCTFFTLLLCKLHPGIDFARLSSMVLYIGQPGPPAGHVLFASHSPRDKFCQKYLSDPVKP